MTASLVWLRLGILPLAGVPGDPSPIQFLLTPHSSSCSFQKPALVPVWPLPLFALPYALGVLISHFLPRPGAWLVLAHLGAVFGLGLCTQWPETQ